jgi:hypothetical protein
MPQESLVVFLNPAKVIGSIREMLLGMSSRIQFSKQGTASGQVKR